MTTRLNRAKLDYELARRGMTGHSLSEETGIPFPSISAARNGRPVRRATLAAIVDALQRHPIVDMGLLEEPDKKTPEVKGRTSGDETVTSGLGASTEGSFSGRSR